MKHVSRAQKSEEKKQPTTRFIRGIIGTDPILNDPRPVIVFAGRSNAGKSSTLNVLLGTSLARISATPGKTQEINYYLVDDRMYFVDLPGYGYAKIRAPEAEKIRKRVIWYLTAGEAAITLLILILDAKAGVTDYDRELIALARLHGHPLLMLANKIDKLNQKERAEAIGSIRDEFADIEIIPFSARTGEGRNCALAAIEAWSGRARQKRRP